MKYPAIEIQNQPRPRKYWFSCDLTDVEFTLPEQDIEEQEEELQSKTVILSEKEMYPLLRQYLEQMGLISKRLDEKRSKNSKGKHANKWLHPDIVAMQSIPDQWDYFVQSCVQAGGGDMLHLWAFELKKTLTMSTLGEDFFKPLVILVGQIMDI